MISADQQADTNARVAAIDVITDELAGTFPASLRDVGQRRGIAIAAVNALREHPDVLCDLAGCRAVDGLVDAAQAQLAELLTGGTNAAIAAVEHRLEVLRDVQLALRNAGAAS